MSVDGNHYLTADIDASAADFTPIGTIDAPFVGSLDGRGHAIKNLRTDRSANVNVGLFSVIGSGGAVSNLSLEDVDVAGDANVAGLAGINLGSISNSLVTGHIEAGHNAIGGLVGSNVGSIVRSVAKVTIPFSAFSDSVGGLVGENNGGVIKESFAAGRAEGREAVGGLVGSNLGDGIIENTYSTVTVDAGADMGGLVGLNSAVVRNSYAVGVVNGGSGFGFVGKSVGAPNYSSNYWNTQTSGTSDGSGGIDPAGIIGVTTAELRNDSTLAGWEFTDIWIMAGYPHLRMEAGFMEVDDGWRMVTNVVDLQLMAIDLAAKYVLAGDVDASETADWNFNGSFNEGFQPIGHDPISSLDDDLEDSLEFDGNNKFTGILRGAGHTITGLYIKRPEEDFVGLFGYVQSPSLNAANWAYHAAAIENLYLNEPRIVGRRFVGGIAGLSEAKIENVRVVASDPTSTSTAAYIKAGGLLRDASQAEQLIGFNVGGLVGKSSQDRTSAIIESSTSILVTFDSTPVGDALLRNVGGLAGQTNEAAIVVNSSSHGDVIVRQVAVSKFFDVPVEDPHEEDPTNFNAHIGGLIGEHDGIAMGTFVDGARRYVEATGRVEGARNVGGLVGEVDGIIEFGRSVGSEPVSGGRNVGGFAGKIENRKLIEPGIVLDSYSDRLVLGVPILGLEREHAGGFVGQNEGGRIERSYSTGRILAVNFNKVGGFAGSAQISVEGTPYDHGEGIGVSLIMDAYSTGTATGNDDVGGFAGQIGQFGQREAVIRRSYSTGSAIAAEDRAGGFVGDHKSVIADSFTIGRAFEGDKVPDFAEGGFAGRVQEGSISNGWWSTNINQVGIGVVESPGTIALSWVRNFQDFYQPTHAVYVNGSDWDFATVWKAQPNGLPILEQRLRGDYDSSGSVDEQDYGLWKSDFGSTTDLLADGSRNGVVDAVDYTVWRDNLGASFSPVFVLPGDYDRNGVVGPSDYGLWKSTFGQIVAAATGADGSGNGVVDAADYTLWRDWLGAGAMNSSKSVGDSSNGQVDEMKYDVGDSSVENVPRQVSGFSGNETSSNFVVEVAPHALTVEPVFIASSRPMFPHAMPSDGYPGLFWASAKPAPGVLRGEDARYQSLSEAESAAQQRVVTSRLLISPRIDDWKPNSADVERLTSTEAVNGSRISLFDILGYRRSLTNSFSP